MKVKTILTITIFFCLGHYVNAQDVDSETVANSKKAFLNLTTNQKKNSNKLLRYLMVTGYLDGKKSIMGPTNFNREINRENGTVRLFAYNLSIIEILNHSPIKANRVILDVKDPSKYMYLSSYGNKDDWEKENTYSYEWVVPIEISSIDLFNKSLAEEFGVKFGMEKQLIKVWILKKTSQSEKFKSIGGLRSVDLLKGKYISTDLSAFVNGSIAKYSNLIVLDETNYPGKIDMGLNISDWNDIDSIRNQLNNYGLDLVEDTREMEMFVVREVKR